MRKLMAAKLMIAYLMVLFGLTLGGFYQPRAPRNFVPLHSILHDFRVGGPEFVVNLLGNLAAFLPMGWLLPTLLGDRCSARRVAILSMVTSLIIEVIQGVSGRRVADVDDILLNSLGGLMGYGLRLGMDRLFVREAGADRRGVVADRAGSTQNERHRRWGEPVAPGRSSDIERGRS